MIRSCLKGVLIGWALLALILMFNVMNLRELVFSSSDGPLAAFLLMVAFAITFGNASIGHAVMSLWKNDRHKD